MERYFITGSTGLIGNALAGLLVSLHKPLHLLVRSPSKLTITATEGVHIFQGDITDYNTVEKAMKGCTHVFHLAACATQFDQDPGVFDRVNVDGTRNVLQAAFVNQIEKVVYTSTAGLFPVTSPLEDANEESEMPSHFMTDYIRTKFLAESLVNGYSEKGLSITKVYPTRVYGPGSLRESNSVTRILKFYSEGKWPFIPGDGKTFGNYVFLEDVVRGILKAMQSGKPGDGYILGGENVTFDELFRNIKMASNKNHILVHVPYPVLWFGSTIIKGIAMISGKPPLITPGWIRRYLEHRRLSSDKAIRELGYSITPLSDGLTKTMTWLNQL
ncbi:MAG TPA: hypothetical protein DCY35_03860 [Prolixibacteraceae bacterium]|nr:hypothetical protein [Prolixibacteraceae bacterium]